MVGDTYPVNGGVGAGEPGIWCTGEESLRLTSRSGDADAIITLGIRFQNDDRARPNVYQERHVPNTDRTAGTSEYPLGSGWLKSLTAIASSGSPAFAHTYLVIDLIRGRGTNATVIQTLMQGPVSALTRRAWPGSPLAASIEGPGTLRSITGTDPAANVSISETVPTGARWRVHALAVTLVTDANVANREVSITFDDGTTVYAVAAAGANQAASLTRRYTAARGGVRGAAATAAEISIALPDLWLPAGHRIKTVTTNFQAGDNFGAPQLLVEEHLEGA